jgi:hypothetical protein
MTKTDYTSYFTESERLDGKKFVKLTKGTPEKVKDLVMKIHMEHFDCLPDDWIYRTISEAFSDLQNDSLENITIEANPYYTDLWEWLGNSYAKGFCNEALQEGITDQKDIYNIIGCGQYMAKELIYHAVDEFLEREKNDSN